MNTFVRQSQALSEALGNHKTMVLSTSFKDKVTARTMSIVMPDGIFYFQTGNKSRKYAQLQSNTNIAMCIDNIQIEGICEEPGHPLENPEFCKLYQEFFKGSYDAYSSIAGERAFAVKPAFIQKWIYENTEPFVETYDFESSVYKKEPYVGE